MTTECERCHQWMEELLAGGIDDDAMKQLLEHVEGCDECRRLWDLHDDLRDLGPTTPEPSEHELRRMRRGVIRTIESEEKPTGARAWWRLAASVAAAGILLVAGFWAGRGGGQGGTPTASTPGPAATDIELASFVDRIAAASRDLAESEESPFIYSDVRVREVEEGRLALAFNVTTHLELERAVDDPLVAEVLVQSLLHPGSLGGRLEAIAVAPTLDPRVRAGLIEAMVEDPSVAVRLRAQAKLLEVAPDAALEAAFLEVLAADEAVQMRLQAIDYLVAHGVGAEVIEGAAANGPPETESAVMAHARERLSL